MAKDIILLELDSRDNTTQEDSTVMTIADVAMTVDSVVIGHSWDINRILIGH